MDIAVLICPQCTELPISIHQWSMPLKQCTHVLADVSVPPFPDGITTSAGSQSALGHIRPVTIKWKQSICLYTLGLGIGTSSGYHCWRHSVRNSIVANDSLYILEHNAFHHASVIINHQFLKYRFFKLRWITVFDGDIYPYLLTSWHTNVCRVTGPFWGNHGWTPLTKGQ